MMLCELKTIMKNEYESGRISIDCEPTSSLIRKNKRERVTPKQKNGFGNCIYN